MEVSETNPGFPTKQFFPPDDDDGGNGKFEVSTVDSNQTIKIPPLNPVSSPFLNPNQSTSKSVGNCKTIMKKNKRVLKEFRGSSSYASPSSSSSSSQHKVLRITSKRRSPKVIIGFGGGGSRRGDVDLDALALPLGMSFAAIVAQVLDRKTSSNDRIPADHLSKICTSALKESLANVYGARFDCFVRNFEKSFESTLRTLRMINTTVLGKEIDPSRNSIMEEYCSEVDQRKPFNQQKNLLSSSSTTDHHSHAGPSCRGVQEAVSSVEDIKENMWTKSLNQELILHRQVNQQLASVSPKVLDSRPSGFSQSMLTTFERSVMEQARSNELKMSELLLKMKQLQLKESQLALTSDSNYLERFKLSMGISKASFKAEKFKTQLEDTRHAELLRKCIDCLVAGMFIMSASLLYGAYVYSYQRITEATSSCGSPPKVSNSWWMPKPVASFNSGLHSLRCLVEVASRMLFGLLVILTIAYLLLQRSSASKQAMPVTFILLLLGGLCGFVGKLCVDTLGGNGYHWLIYWEVLCTVHFFANIWTSALFILLHGPVPASPGSITSPKFPYWTRRFVFYGTTLLFLPVLCGLMPFAGPSDWKDHFSLLATDALFGSEVWV